MRRMKNFLKITKRIFLITDHLISSLFYAGLILVVTIFVWVGFMGLAQAYEARYVWELSVFAFSFFALFHFFLKKKQYSFNEYVISLVPISALLLIISMGFVFMSSKDHNPVIEKTGEVLMLAGMLLLSFALSHTSILIFRNKLNDQK
jgi:hypothetical protein